MLGGRSTHIALCLLSPIGWTSCQTSKVVRNTTILTQGVCDSLWGCSPRYGAVQCRAALKCNWLAGDDSSKAGHSRPDPRGLAHVTSVVKKRQLGAWSTARTMQQPGATGTPGPKDWGPVMWVCSSYWWDVESRHLCLKPVVDMCLNPLLKISTPRVCLIHFVSVYYICTPVYL